MSIEIVGTQTLRDKAAEGIAAKQQYDTVESQMLDLDLERALHPLTPDQLNKYSNLEKDKERLFTTIEKNLPDLKAYTKQLKDANVYNGDVGGIPLPAISDEKSLYVQLNTKEKSATIDHRIRIRPFPGSVDKVYGGVNSIIGHVLHPQAPGGTNGCVFPYTPTFSVSHSASYDPISMVHSNQDMFSYRKTDAIEISISGKFTASNYREAQYTFACMHFLRSCTKMHFGDNDANKGLPPPILLLSGYGAMMFNDLPIIIKSVSFDYQEAIDTVPVMWTTDKNPTPKPIAWIPVLQNITVVIIIQNTPKRMREFTWDSYCKGDLIYRKGGFL